MTTLNLSQLNYLLEEFPEQHALISRLDDFIFNLDKPVTLTSKEAMDILQPKDFRPFVLIMHNIEYHKNKNNLVQFRLKVNSPTGKEVNTFKSITDIPDTLIDPDTHEQFSVLLPYVDAIYQFNPPALNSLNTLKL